MLGSIELVSWRFHRLGSKSWYHIPNVSIIHENKIYSKLHDIMFLWKLWISVPSAKTRYILNILHIYGSRHKDKKHSRFPDVCISMEAMKIQFNSGANTRNTNIDTFNSVTFPWNLWVFVDPRYSYVNSMEAMERIHQCKMHLHLTQLYTAHP